MTKFRKKPVVIEAEQWFPGIDVDGVVPAEFDAVATDGTPHKVKRYDLMGVKTLEGFMHVSSGDWIITGVNGEKYPCKPDIFEKTYEPVE